VPKVYIVNSEYQADEKIYIVTSEYQADKKVYIVNSEYQADKKAYIVTSEYQAFSQRTRSGRSSGRRPRSRARWIGEASSTPTRRGRCSMPYAPSSPAGNGSSPSSRSCITPGSVPRKPSI
jgi:hypothetical protein